MDKILVVLGPTATGKTELGLRMAKKFHGEIVSCDSRQVYKRLDIGTGKVPSIKYQISSIKKQKGKWVINSINIWMFDVIDPKKQYTVADYVKDAGKVVDDIADRGKLPIIVGGTGLYLKALLEGLSNLDVPIDKDLRKELEELPLEELQQRLQRIAPRRWNKINNSDRNNPRRLIRAIELSVAVDKNVAIATKISTGLLERFDVLKIGLIAPRDLLYQKVDESVGKRIKQGMVEEAKRLHQEGLSFKKMRQLGLEYRVLADYLEKKRKSLQELTSILQGKIHGYVRRQLTWFKKVKEVNWFDIQDKNFPPQVEKLTYQWYHQADVSSKN